LRRSVKKRVNRGGYSEMGGKLSKFVGKLAGTPSGQRARVKGISSCSTRKGRKRRVLRTQDEGWNIGRRVFWGEREHKEFRWEAPRGTRPRFAGKGNHGDKNISNGIMRFGRESRERVRGGFQAVLPKRKIRG